MAFWYFLALLLVYLAFPYDLGFMFQGSDRTMLHVHMIFIAAAYALCCLEKDRPAGSPAL